MNNTSRVGNISTSTSVSSSNSWESSRSNTSNSYSVSYIGDTISCSNRSSKTIAIAKTSVTQTSITQSSVTSIEESRVCLSLSFSSNISCKANHKSNLDHVHSVTGQFRIPMLCVDTH